MNEDDPDATMPEGITFVGSGDGKEHGMRSDLRGESEEPSCLCRGCSPVWTSIVNMPPAAVSGASVILIFAGYESALLPTTTESA